MSREESSKWFNEVVPALAKLLLKLPSLLELHYQHASMDILGDGVMVTTALRILEPHQPGVVCLSQELIAALLGCSLFCLFPDNHRQAKDLPPINFDQLFAEGYQCCRPMRLDKIWCILHYFERITSYMPKGMVSFERRAHSTDIEFWMFSDIPLCKFEVYSSGPIEDQSDKAVEVYFADKFFGGDALVRGILPEELRFMFSPELIAGMLFLPAMKDNEAIEIVGAERFSTYRGYKSSFRYSGVYVDRTDVDSLGRRKTRIVAVDKVCIPNIGKYTTDIFLCEINKALCGFLYHGMDQVNNIGVATGEGKYVFPNKERDPELKAILKWLAASQAHRPFIAYCTYGLATFQDLGKVSQCISSQRWTVGDLWHILNNYLNNDRQKTDSFFQWIQLSHGHTCVFLQVDPPFSACDPCERERVSSRMDKYVRYLPLRKRYSSLYWSSEAVKVLKQLTEGLYQSGEELFSAISGLRGIRHYGSHIPKSSFDGFVDFFDIAMSREESSKWFNEVVPALAKLLLKLPSLLELHYQNANMDILGNGVMVTTALRILEPQQPGVVCLSHELIAALLVCLLFFPIPEPTQPVKDLPVINFDQLFAFRTPLDFSNLLKRRNQLNKIWCIIRYFERISSDMPKGIVSFERRVLPLENDSTHGYYPDGIFWSNSAIPLCKFKVNTSGLIEDQSSEAIEVYFAGKNLGGDALGMGTSQEEIRFMLSPELIAGMLFLPAMKENEAIEIVGVERFSTYAGFESAFRYSDVYVDKTDIDTLGRRKSRIVAVDELCVPETKEYTADIFICEINKAYCGFLCHGMDEGNNIGVATGDRGIGEDPEIKAIIQWLAASQAQRPFIAYCTYDLEALQNLGKVVLWISRQSWTVGFLWNALIRYSTRRSKGDTFFQWLRRSWSNHRRKRVLGGFTWKKDLNKKGIFRRCTKRKRSHEDGDVFIS